MKLLKLVIFLGSMIVDQESIKSMEWLFVDVVNILSSLQYFDPVGWATGKASDVQNSALVILVGSVLRMHPNVEWLWKRKTEQDLSEETLETTWLADMCNKLIRYVSVFTKIQTSHACADNKIGNKPIQLKKHKSH